MCGSGLSVGALGGDGVVVESRDTPHVPGKVREGGLGADARRTPRRRDLYFGGRSISGTRSGRGQVFRGGPPTQTTEGTRSEERVTPPLHSFPPPVYRCGGEWSGRTSVRTGSDGTPETVVVPTLLGFWSQARLSVGPSPAARTPLPGFSSLPRHTPGPLSQGPFPLGRPSADRPPLRHPHPPGVGVRRPLRQEIGPFSPWHTNLPSPLWGQFHRVNPRGEGHLLPSFRSDHSVPPDLRRRLVGGVDGSVPR